MKPFQHILVPADFCEPAKHARETAIMIARKFDAAITLYHAYYLPPLPYGAGFVGQMGDIRAMAEAAMEKELAEAQREYPKVKAIVRGASPADGILDAARELPADLIVMGTQGRRGVSRFVLGSVAQNIVRLATIPVMTVSAQAEG
jgi:nucleotide-binding universal stress UspA family protein